MEDEKKQKENKNKNKKGTILAVILVFVLIFIAALYLHGRDADKRADSSDTAETDEAADTTAAGAEDETAETESTAQDNSGEDEIALPLLTVTLTVEDVTDGVVTVQIDNQSGEVFTYYDSFVLEREENGEWKQVPFLEDAEFNEIAYELSDLCAHTKEYDLFAYCGELEAGNYRITISDISAEFTLP